MCMIELSEHPGLSKRCSLFDSHVASAWDIWVSCGVSVLSRLSVVDTESWSSFDVDKDGVTFVLRLSLIKRIDSICVLSPLESSAQGLPRWSTLDRSASWLARTAGLVLGGPGQEVRRTGEVWGKTTSSLETCIASRSAQYFLALYAECVCRKRQTVKTQVHWNK